MVRTCKRPRNCKRPAAVPRCSTRSSGRHSAQQKSLFPIYSLRLPTSRDLGLPTQWVGGSRARAELFSRAMPIETTEAAAHDHGERGAPGSFWAARRASHHVLSHMCLDTRQSHPFAASVGRRARGRLRLAARAWEKLGAGRGARGTRKGSSVQGSSLSWRSLSVTEALNVFRIRSGSSRRCRVCRRHRYRD